MNVDKIIEAFEEAKKQNIRFGRAAYYSSSRDCYCSVGWLAKCAGVPIEQIGSASLESGINIVPASDRMKNFYECQLNFPQSLFIVPNDAEWKSWDDAIGWVERNRKVLESYE